MTRLRLILFEFSVVFLVGVALATILVTLTKYVQRPTLKTFAAEYTTAKSLDRQAISSRYLQLYPAQELLVTLEDSYKDTLCHSQAHQFGRAVYERSKNLAEAVKQCAAYCSYGCFHGVIMEVFTTDSDTLGGVFEYQESEQYLSQLTINAQGLCTKPEVASVVLARQCYHGLGHVFAYGAALDIEKATAACGVFADPLAEISCRSGVFMESVYAAAEATTSVAYLKSAQPCDAFPESTYMCYSYKAYGWLSVWGGIVPALKACDTFGGNTMQCIGATAMAASSASLLATEEGIDSLCGSLEGEKKVMCVDGALTKIINISNGDDTEHICDGVVPSYHERCLEARKQYRVAVKYEN